MVIHKPIPQPCGQLPEGVALKPVIGFESTDYAYCDTEIVWVGKDAVTTHPRMRALTPKFPPNGGMSQSDRGEGLSAPHKLMSTTTAFPPRFASAPRGGGTLQVGAQICVAQIAAADTKGLLLWLTNRELAFPLNHAAPRFDAVRAALQTNDMPAFEQASIRVLGLGHGLTPSGDDFLGGIFFALAHRPYPDWSASLPTLQANICKACETATNPISAALLADNMAGASYGVLHDMLDALESNDAEFIAAACKALLSLGSSSGADLLAGLLLALTL